MHEAWRFHPHPTPNPNTVVPPGRVREDETRLDGCMESRTMQVLAVGTATVQVRKQWPQLVEVQRSSREAQVCIPHQSALRRARAFRNLFTRTTFEPASHAT
jgi:hypothetical protein